MSVLLSHPDKVSEQGEPEGPVQLYLVLYEDVLQWTATAPLPHQRWSRRLCEAAQQWVEVLVT